MNSGERKAVVTEVMRFLKSENLLVTGQSCAPHAEKREEINHSPPSNSPKVRFFSILTAIGLVPLGMTSLPICWFSLVWFAFGEIALNLLLDCIPYFGRKSRVKYLILVMVGVGACLMLRTTVYKAWVREKAVVLSGDISSTDVLIDPNSTNNSLPLLQVGDGATTIVWKGDQNKPEATSGPDQLLIKRVNGKIELSIEVRDKTGSTVVQISKNHWTVSSNNAICWDKNYTKNSLEVLDGSRRSILQVRMFSDGIQLQVERPSGGSYTEVGKVDPEKGPEYLFQYPSSLYWGKFSDNYLIR